MELRQVVKAEPKFSDRIGRALWRASRSGAQAASLAILQDSGRGQLLAGRHLSHHAKSPIPKAAIARRRAATIRLAA